MNIVAAYVAVSVILWSVDARQPALGSPPNGAGHESADAVVGSSLSRTQPAPSSALARGGICGELEGEPVCFPGYIDTFNGGCSAASPAFSSITPGVSICGESSIEKGPGGFVEDSDWYEFVVAAPQRITWSVTADFRFEISIVNGNFGCAPGAPALGKITGLGFTQASLTEPVQPGVYWLVVKPDGDSDQGQCGANYTALLTVTEWDPPLAPSEVGTGHQAVVVGNWDGHPPSQLAADVWADDRGYAYVGSREGPRVDIMDLSDPANPVLLTTYLVPPPNDLAAAKDVKVADGLMYIVLDGGGVDGAQIVDVRDPSNPQLLTNINVPGFSNVHNLFYDSGYLYLVRSFVNSFVVLDLTGYDPDNPPASITQEKWRVDNVGSSFLHDVTVVNGRAYVAAWDSGVWIYDVSNVANQPPSLIASARGQSTHSAWPSADGRWIVTNEERSDGGPVKLYELTEDQNGATLTHVFTYSIPLTEAPSSHNVYLFGLRAYCAWYNRGLMAFDIHPATKSLVWVAQFDTTAGTSAFNGAWGIYPFLGRDQVLLSAKDTQFWVFDVRVPGSGDFDGDADRDLYDYGAFQRCFSGDGTPYIDPACEIHDFNQDGDVDLDDYVEFEQAFSN